MRTAGRKSLTLLSTELQGNDNVFVHFSILESLACRVRKKYNFCGCHGYLRVKVSLRVSTPLGDQ